MDKNNDSQLSIKEFSQGMKRVHQTSGPGRGPQQARLTGYSGGQQFGPPAQAGPPTGPAPDIMRERVLNQFKTLDKNQDGKLTKDEAPPRIQQNFDKFDSDKKGYLTPRDLYRALTQMRQGAGGQKPVDKGAEKTPEKPQDKEKPE